MTKPLRKGEAGQPGHPGQFAKGRFASADEAVGFDDTPDGGDDPPARSPTRITTGTDEAVASRLTAAFDGEVDVEVAASDEHPLVRAQAVGAPGLSDTTGRRLSADRDVQGVLGFIMR